MTLGDAAAVAIDPRAVAFGYTQSRIWVFFAWSYGAVIAISGSVDAALSGLLAHDTLTFPCLNQRLTHAINRTCFTVT